MLFGLLFGLRGGEGQEVLEVHVFGIGGDDADFDAAFGGLPQFVEDGAGVELGGEGAGHKHDFFFKLFQYNSLNYVFHKVTAEAFLLSFQVVFAFV